MKSELKLSRQSRAALTLVEELQDFFVKRLNQLSYEQDGLPFEPVPWSRNGGTNGGGVRYQTRSDQVFDRASVNVSQVHYEETSARPLTAATALSTIIHPQNPFAPSLHLHISWTELKDGQAYWRLMADLNPAIPFEQDSKAFATALQEAAGPLLQEGQRDGDAYFNIPAFNRTRGVVHFYLENYASPNPAADEEFARSFGMKMLNEYIEILRRAIRRPLPVTARERDEQLAYHSLYFIQVLTLDRGTTAGLLAHDDNDIGTLGSLPSKVDRRFIERAIEKLPALQAQLMTLLLGTLDLTEVPRVDETEKAALAAALRGFYHAHPEALSHLARGSVLPAAEFSSR